MEQSMGSATTTNTPTSQVDDLIKAVADEAGLEISEQLASVPTGNNTLSLFRYLLFKDLFFLFQYLKNFLIRNRTDFIFTSNFKPTRDSNQG